MKESLIIATLIVTVAVYQLMGAYEPCEGYTLVLADTVCRTQYNSAYTSGCEVDWGTGDMSFNCAEVGLVTWSFF